MIKFLISVAASLIMLLSHSYLYDIGFIKPEPQWDIGYHYETTFTG